MSKRGGEPTRAGNSKVKKRKNVKIRTTLIPDSDEETPLPNANAEYMRWVKTCITTSGDGSVTTSRIPLVDMSETKDDPLLPLEVDTDYTTLEDTVRATTTTQRRQRKSNDSVSW